MIEVATGMAFERAMAELLFQPLGMHTDKKLKDFLIDRKLFTADELTALESAAQKAVDDSIDFARKSTPAKPEDGVQNVYAKGTVAPTQFLNGVAPVAYNYNPDTPIFGKHIPLIT